ncbi:sensor histidine kinase [Desulforamulus aeronauticus]|uniref:histidine kinase n=1 Tax=Desulforamulus aeronauticus DSM 10349 TaxID=1121421 RepID=A0A1M6W736_9FIRM|nr:sensor histidine kinase KdpD [Desulforamulus aeronauticus]SHK89316.1 two-component system, OmpR family, sensor histidine kinase KdpD [Desulforamulus aeronauticus DSM 10349]
MLKERRVNPDVLASMEKEGQGKLTVFLGAAAGVGKTFAMLEAAQERMAEGVEVVIGWVETHGRIETEALLKGLPVVPPKCMEYRDREFGEMDLDGILARKPEIALVDELAHTNIPGSRHAHRYQDVQELLAAGIHVYTTLNIQHLETLNDVVAQITGVTVRETVPDRILEQGAQIQLVDIRPEELIQRLKDGKIYVPGQAQEALRRFFRPGNINALRELALRYTARRVDRQVESYMRLHGITGPWPTGERVLVCISASPFSAPLIRIAKRMAEGLQAEWLAVYVDTPRRFPVREEERDQLAKNLHLAEELGAETINVSGNDVAEELLELARKRNVSQIIIGKPLYSRLWELMHGSVVDKVIRKSEGISVHVIPGNPKLLQGQQKVPQPTQQPIKELKSLYPYLASLVMMVGLTLVAAPLKNTFGLVNLAMLFLLPVLLSAVKWGTRPSIATAIMGVIGFDFFVVPPTISFTVTDIRYVITFLIFVMIALFTSRLSTRLRQQIVNSRRREARISALYSLSKDIAAVAEPELVLESIVKKVAETIECQVVLLLPEKDTKLVLKASSENEGESYINEHEYAVATWVFTRGQKAGKGTDTLGAAEGLYLPLRADKEICGVLGICSKDANTFFEPEQLRLLEAFVSLASVTVTRVKLAEQAREAQTLAESERLRNALFNSLSHDLRTPLASIIGAASGLLENDEVFSEEARRDLLQSIQQGALRMNRFVHNLLDMAKLEGGLVRPNKEWCDMQDIIGVAISRLEESLGTRLVDIKVQNDLPLVKVDFILIEQVLVNLMDNALKYSEPGTEIAVEALPKGQEIEVTVADRGPEIPEEDIERIFDKFYRLQSPRLVSGTGLGLAICKGFVEAHGGKIWAANQPGRGVEMKFTLPLEDQPPVTNE